jgi:hypothetical protein
MGYKRWTPSSRRDRRRRGEYRRGTTQGVDRTFFVIAGLFFLAVILLLATLMLFTG